ncbi:MAG: glycolate oxidase subunit GlcE [Gammaproteobacteria bacterium]|nr:glycolate oxidase subunit GlcE [Gammaproteobacteria bacterium]
MAGGGDTLGGDEEFLRATVQEAHRAARPLRIIGGGSKAFYGRAVAADAAPLHTAGHHGVAHYDPAELVLTARAGTPLAVVEELLAAENQMLGFEPPRFGDGGGDGSAAGDGDGGDGNGAGDGADTGRGSIGGAVAAGLAGPRRPYTGAVRDFVLGVKIVSGRGEILRFGGEVMKNVAGFDLSRLMAGALGTLGVLLEISLRVLPRPAAQQTLRLEHADSAAAVALFNRLAARPLPLSAAAWHLGETRIRLSGSDAGVARAAAIIGGEADPAGGEFWRRLRDHELAFFAAAPELLRVSLPPASAWAPPDSAAQLIDWGGAQRWLAADDANGVQELRATVAQHGGHVTRFRHGGRGPGPGDPGDGGGDGDRDRAPGNPAEVFHPLPAPLYQLHRRLKRAFDPAGILNPGRLHPDG